MNNPLARLTNRQWQWLVLAIFVAVVCIASAIHSHSEHIYTPTEVCQGDWNTYGIHTGESHGYYMAVCEQNLKTEVKVREQQDK